MRVIIEAETVGELDAPDAPEKLRKATAAAAVALGHAVPVHGGEWDYTADLAARMRTAYEARMMRLRADLESLLNG